MNRQLTLQRSATKVCFLGICLLAVTVSGCLPNPSPDSQQPPELLVRTVSSVSTEYSLELGLGHIEIQEVAEGLVTQLLDDLRVEDANREFIIVDWKDLLLEVDHMYGVWAVTGVVDVLFQGVMAGDGGFLPEGEYATVSVGERNLVNENGMYILSLDRGEPKEAILHRPQISRDTSLGIGVMLDYADQEILVFHGYFGLFVYSFERDEITLSADLKTAVGTTIIQGSEGAAVRVSADGGVVQLYFYPERREPKFAFYIDPRTGTYTYGDYRRLDTYFAVTDDLNGRLHVAPGETAWTLENLTYTEAGGSRRLFANWNWDE